MSSDNSPRVFAIHSKDPTVVIWKGGLEKTVVQLISKSGLAWQTCGLYRYGTDFTTLDKSPPTVIVFTSDSQDAGWKDVATNVRKAMQSANCVALFQVLQDQVRDLADGWQMPNPQNDPRRLGESCSVHIASPGHRPNGTMGGSFTLQKGGETKIVGVTNNHVVNVQPDGEQYDKFTSRPVVIASDSDHHKSLDAKVGPTVTQNFDDWVLKAQKLIQYRNPKCEHPSALLISALDNLKNMVLPSKLDQTFLTPWEKFLDVWATTRRLDQVQPLINQLNAMKLPSDLAGIQSDLELAKFYLDKWTSHFQAWKDFRAVDDSEMDKRHVGTSLCASGLRATVPPQGQDSVILDWALVEGSKTSYNNTSEDLAKFAKTIWDIDQRSNRVLASCALKDWPAMKITQTAPLLHDDIVFKIGRTTGCTIGRVNGLKSTSNIANHRKLGTGFLQASPITSLKEWEITSMQELHVDIGQSRFPSPFCRQGDSGSWVLNRDGKLVGLLWGGMDTKDVSKVTPISDVIESIEQVSGGWKVVAPH